MAVLSECISQGSRAAVQAELQTEAVIRCQTALGEIIAGVQPLQSASGMAFEDGAPGWSWSAEILPGPHPDLLLVEVTVEHATQTGRINAEYSLNRLLRDPQLILDAAATAAATAAAMEAGL